MDERVWPFSSAQADSQTTFAALVKVDIRVADAYAMQTCYSVYGSRERGSAGCVLLDASSLMADGNAGKQEYLV